jgi:hypothetical protein
MSQHDYDIANGSGSTVRADLNNVLAAILSLNSGATAPTTTVAYMLWYDTTAAQLKMRNAANNAWVTIGAINGSNFDVTGVASSGVTQLNGQAGAITNTTIGNIGNYVAAVYVPGAHPGTNSMPINVGDTVAGSTLRYNYSVSAMVNGHLGDLAGRSTASGTTTYGSGGTTPSGTWRCVARPAYYYDPEGPGYHWIPGLFVRVS